MCSDSRAFTLALCLMTRRRHRGRMFLLTGTVQRNAMPNRASERGRTRIRTTHFPKPGAGPFLPFIFFSAIARFVHHRSPSLVLALPPPPPLDQFKVADDYVKDDSESRSSFTSQRRREDRRSRSRNIASVLRASSLRSNLCTRARPFLHKTCEQKRMRARAVALAAEGAKVGLHNQGPWTRHCFTVEYQFREERGKSGTEEREARKEANRRTRAKRNERSVASPRWNFREKSLNPSKRNGIAFFGGRTTKFRNLARRNAAPCHGRRDRKRGSARN